MTESTSRSDQRHSSHGSAREHLTCPKDMVYGPCGGVQADTTCEVDDRTCPFHAKPVVVDNPGRRHRPRSVPLTQAIIDLRLPPDDKLLDEIASMFRAVGATALIGEHLDDPAGTTPVASAERLANVGLPAIVTVSGRRRSVSEHDTQIRGLVAAGVVAVHCVTGDHPAVRFGPGHESAFTLDGTRLTTLARAGGALVSVAESPAAPPQAARAERIALKETSGADIAILNHAGSTAALVDFADWCVSVGTTLDVVAPVPVITDHDSAHALAQFPGLVLPDGLVRRVLDSSEPKRAGIEAAIEMAQELLDTGRFAAVNLSGSAGGSGPLERAEIMTAVASALSNRLASVDTGPRFRSGPS